MTRERLCAVDLFAGAGGLSLGLRRAGFRVRAAVEIDADASTTYRRNHPNVHLVTRDVRQVSGAELLAHTVAGRVHLLTGCAPCQGFCSLTTKNRTEDPRNSLVLEMARIVEETAPDAVIMENVPGLAIRGADLFREFLQRLDAAGYYAQWSIVQMANFGIPQNRRRLVLLAGRGFTIAMPMQTHARVPHPELGIKRWLSLRDVIGGERAPRSLAKSRAHGGPRVLNWNVVRDLQPQTKARLRAAEPGKTWAAIDESLRPDCHRGDYCGFGNVYGRMSWDQLPVTITAGCTTPAKGRFGHPDRRRSTISVREAASLQTFPKSYRFATNKIDVVCGLIGNAVPPDFAELLARQARIAIAAHYQHV